MFFSLLTYTRKIIWPLGRLKIDDFIQRVAPFLNLLCNAPIILPRLCFSFLFEWSSLPTFNLCGLAIASLKVCCGVLACTWVPLPSCWRPQPAAPCPAALVKRWPGVQDPSSPGATGLAWRCCPSSMVNRALACVPSAPRLYLGNPLLLSQCVFPLVFCIWQSLLFPILSHL